MNKYYTPKVEEFYVGFECEIKKVDGNYNWTEHIFYEENYFDLENYSIIIRVKYLDKKDIEFFGFKNTGKSICNGYLLEGRFKDNYCTYGYWKYISLIHCKDNSGLHIVAYEHSLKEEGQTLFQGKIKNKTELKRLLIQLNVIK